MLSELFNFDNSGVGSSILDGNADDQPMSNTLKSK